ncbi:ammonium transporter 2 [Phakopsora pachyrhizi]|uniref:Ammonium transporter n=1 Tax=Phakopsora pachyrhizi TaxID=170000 RepID=A0AAV0AUP8_PHAPC|nr:ammonium transporter 2 [Phakopsora pachyrhizi]
MPYLAHGSLSNSNSSEYLGIKSILSSKGTDILAFEDDGKIFAYSPGDIAWILICSALVWLMVPGIAFVYSGMVKGKNALSLLLLPLLAMSVVSIQFWFWGFSLAFSRNANLFIGNLDYIGLENLLSQPEETSNDRIPSIAFVMLQHMQASLVGAVAIGSAAERGRVGPTMLFMFFWATLVYCPLVAWMYNPAGWAYRWGVLDYGGGVTMEICSGVTGLAYSLFIGRRTGYGVKIRPHSVPHVVLGTCLLWFGWLGLNGSGSGTANVRAGLVMVETHLAACAGGLTWLIMDFRLEGKWSLISYCMGAISGLVAVTPSGLIGTSASVLIGAIGAAVANTAVAFRSRLPWDDGLDIFAGHAISGAVGVMLTGIFAQKSIAKTDGYTIVDGGVLDGNWKQLYKQLAWIAAGGSWSFIITYMIFRVSPESEIKGIDKDQSGEVAYDFRASVFLNEPLSAKHNRRTKAFYSSFFLRRDSMMKKNLTPELIRSPKIQQGYL